MEKISILLKLSFKFFKQYIKQYLKMLLKPAAALLIGFIAFFIGLLNPVLGMIAIFILIPCICYGFWRGFLITYALNIAAYYFIKNNSNASLEECYKLALNKEKDFALYITFFAFLSLIFYIPALLHAISLFKEVAKVELLYTLTDTSELLNLIKPCYKDFIITTLLLVPLINFVTQAYLFKKNEGYFKLFLNCYTKLDITGLVIAYTINIFCMSYPILYTLTFAFVNVFVYSINTFWYYSKISKNH